ncbi:hypothetical protein GUITHDRAFT_115735 [Guillardia theta CCMP2712]|uniref:Uncharacterized protein n=1 Tax=Guillardia theta (strain CCMP2712) TaxID=905079 RepID=L1IPH4_GUITC|nr:hypothetical protein GUITHDRAFT_115735 [Guillardia theta CCMP2712]EKX38191.1 hypothetical protein GUITHDRAFT_115735 [Guillardia theta CCMP2712]|eukprot:XP_005825171.1 hypothetical protein GUITHDRAFT_115735 [Guillardia theta CCMP2712]
MSSMEKRLSELKTELAKCDKVLTFFRNSARTEVTRLVDEIQDRKTRILEEMSVVKSVIARPKGFPKKKIEKYVSVASGVMIF